MADKRKGVGATPKPSADSIISEFKQGALTKEQAATELEDLELSAEVIAERLSKASSTNAQSKQITFDNTLSFVNSQAEGRNFVDQLKALLASDGSPSGDQIDQAVEELVRKNPTLGQPGNEAKLVTELVNNEIKLSPSLSDPANVQALEDFRAFAVSQALAVSAKKAAAASTANGSARYPKVAYYDTLSNGVVQEPEEQVELPALVRYADNLGEEARAESDHPVFLIDAVIWIQGIEVSQFVKGQVSISLSGTDGNNTASFTLDNSNDRFVWSERNLVKFFGPSAALADSPAYRDLQEKIREKVQADQRLLDEFEGSDADALGQSLAERFAFTGDEAIKAEMFAYKADPTRNPPIRNPKNTINFARFDLCPNRAIFSRMDPVRIFSLYPFRVPGKENETTTDPLLDVALESTASRTKTPLGRYELWCPEFVGYIDNVAIEDDDIRGVSSITIDCYDIREGVLNRMRTSTQVMSGLSAPLDSALGFRTGPTSRTETGGTAATPQDQALQAEFKDNTEGYYDINNTAFYDDVAVNPYNQPGTHQSLEEAVYDFLVGKEPITKETNNRGVRGVTLGGNFYYDSKQTNITAARKFLEDWHKFCLFGPKRRPWTREEMEEVGRGTTTDGVFAPNKVRLWFMLPIEGTGAKNLADLSSVSNQMTHEVNWTSRLEVIKNFVSVLDYNFMVTPTGDFVVEFQMSDFRPEDFGEFKSTFRIDKGLMTTSIGDEQSVPPSGLSLQIGFGDGAAANTEIVQAQLSTIYVYSPYIAARYGIETVNESIPALLLKDKKIAQQRAVMMYQKILARSHVLSMSFSYRPFILPNRPLHHLRRSRMGSVVTVDKTISLGLSPKGEVSCGLDHVRLFTGYYRNTEDFPLNADGTRGQKANEVQREDNATKGIDPNDTALLLGIDPVESADPYELQVFTTVAAGESTPSSARVGYGETSVLAPGSGIYVLDLEDARRKTAAIAGESVATAHEDAPVEGDTISPAVLDESPSKDKFRANPLAANPLVVTSPFGPRTFEGKANQPHLGVDLRAAQGTPIFAVEDGIVRQVGIEKGKAGWVVKIVCNNGYTVRYHHCDANLSAGVVSVGQEVKAGQQVGYSGGTKGTAGAGSSKDPHLHFVVRPTDKPGQANNVDPIPLLPGPVSGKTQPKSPNKSTS